MAWQAQPARDMGAEFDAAVEQFRVDELARREQEAHERDKADFVRDFRSWADATRKRGFRGDENLARDFDQAADNMQQRGLYTISKRISADPRITKHQRLRTALNYQGKNTPAKG